MSRIQGDVEILALQDSPRDGPDLVTVTLRGHRSSIKRLLEESGAEAKKKPDPKERAKEGRREKRFRRFWKLLEPGKRKALLAAAFFLQEEGRTLFCRVELERLVSILSEKERPSVSQRSLIHLARRGYAKRHQRGVYSLTAAGGKCIFELRAKRKNKAV